MLAYYDSIYGNRRRSNAPKVIKRFIEHYWRNRGLVIKLKVRVMENAPLQGNGYDCGVFVCQNAEKISRDALVTTKQDEMTEARKSMMKEIFFGCLKVENKLQQPHREPTELKKPRRNKQLEEIKEKPVENREVRKKAQTTANQRAGKSRLKWPKSNSKEWSKLDEDLTALLKILYSPPEKLAISHPKIIYEMCKERYGVMEKSTGKKQPAGPSKRQRKCMQLREEIKKLKQTYLEAPEEEKEGINELQMDKLKKLRLAKRAESLKNARNKFFFRL